MPLGGVKVALGDAQRTVKLAKLERLKGRPEPVRVHDFIIPEFGRTAPYGVYDIADNAGWVNVGIDNDTASFAVTGLSCCDHRDRSDAIRPNSRGGCGPDRLSWSRRAEALLVAHQPSRLALRFFYGVTLGQTEAFERIVGGQKPDKLRSS